MKTSIIKIIAKEILILVSFILLISLIILIFYARYKIAQKYTSNEIRALKESAPLQIDSIYYITEGYMRETFVVNRDTCDVPYYDRIEFLKEQPNAIQIKSELLFTKIRDQLFMPNHIDLFTFKKSASDTIYLTKLYSYVTQDMFLQMYDYEDDIAYIFDKAVGNPLPQKIPTPFKVLYFPTLNDFINKTSLALRFENDKEFKKEVQYKIRKANTIERRKNGTEWNLFIKKYLIIIIVSIGFVLYPIRLIIHATKWAIKTLRDQ